MISVVYTYDLGYMLRISQAFNWGLPDHNELFIGTLDVQTPLHYDERENIFVQVAPRRNACSVSSFCPVQFRDIMIRLNCW